MPATTKKQQKFFQLVKAIQAGKAKGSAEAMELAKTMSPESVEHYTKLEKDANANDNKLLNYAAISALIGLGGAGAYGLAKYYHDKMVLPKELKNLEKDIYTVRNENFLTEDEPPAEEPSLLPEAKSAQEKRSTIPLLDPNVYVNALYYGAATPLAILAPGMLTFHFAKKYLDKKRNERLGADLEAAKLEFEDVLSKKSALQEEVDGLAADTKQADFMAGIREWWNDTPESETTQSSGLRIPGVNIELQPASTTDSEGNTAYDYRPGFGPLGLTFMLGSLAGLSGLGGYMLMRNKLKDDPEAKKTKALKNLLKKELAESAIQAGIKVKDDPSGQKRIEL